PQPCRATVSAPIRVSCPSHGQTSPTCDVPAFHTRRFPCARCQVRHAPGRFHERRQPLHGQRRTGLRERTTHHSEVQSAHQFTVLFGNLQERTLSQTDLAFDRVRLGVHFGCETRVRQHG